MPGVQLPLYAMKSESTLQYFGPSASQSSSKLVSGSLQDSKSGGNIGAAQQTHSEELVSTTIGSPPQQRKRVKRDTISSMSSVEEDMSSVSGESEVERPGPRILQPTSSSSFSYQKSPPVLPSPSEMWTIDHGTHLSMREYYDFYSYNCCCTVKLI